MLSFKSFLIEKTKTKSKYKTLTKSKIGDATIADLMGKLHENLVHYHLNGGVHAKPSHRIIHNAMQRLINPILYDQINARARHAANYIQSNFIQDKELSHVDHTGQTGVKGESQRHNATDIILHFTDGTKKQLSLKAHNQSRSVKPNANPGIIAMQRYFNIPGIVSQHKKAKAEFCAAAGIPTNSTNDFIADTIKKNPHLKPLAKEHATRFLSNLAQQHAQRLDTMDHETKKDFIRTEILRKSGLSSVTTVRTFGIGDKIKTDHIDPEHYEHILNDPNPENITHRIRGNTITFDHPTQRGFASIRFKYNGPQMASGLKGSGGVK